MRSQKGFASRHQFVINELDHLAGRTTDHRERSRLGDDVDFPRRGGESPSSRVAWPLSQISPPGG